MEYDVTEHALVLNGKYFGVNRAHYMRLIDAGLPAVGTFTPCKRTIRLNDASGERIGFINDYAVIGRTFRFQGKYRHQAAPPELIGGLDYFDGPYREEAEAALERFDIARRY